MMNFSSALDEIKAGEPMQRKGWNGAGQFVMIQKPDIGSKMTLPYIYIQTVDRKLVPWFASQTDILAEDWQHADSDS